MHLANQVPMLHWQTALLGLCHRNPTTARSYPLMEPSAQSGFGKLDIETPARFQGEDFGRTFARRRTRFCLVFWQMIYHLEDSIMRPNCYHFLTCSILTALRCGWQAETGFSCARDALRPRRCGLGRCARPEQALRSTGLQERGRVYAYQSWRETVRRWSVLISLDSIAGSTWAEGSHASDRKSVRHFYTKNTCHRGEILTEYFRAVGEHDSPYPYQLISPTGN